MAIGDAAYFIHACALSEQVNRDDGSRPRRDGRRYSLRQHIVSLRIDVDENEFCSQVDRRNWLSQRR